MADLNNLTEITENFDTIKTLLNSIRAQGILNTSDVDKLLTGINSKLEKLNTEEDIDLIKIFLSELKQNLDERHNVLLSKFGAIESLFSNLLKNSAEAPKSSEIKELFDIVATNLSVFSREVVSQKETLSDITLRLDAMRSDDSQKKDIIKNITLLKNDIERLTNGFDSIVLSLNENFKTIIKTISGIDPTENINKFGEEIADIMNSSNTILSAVQMLDKKNLQIEDALRGLATQDDLNAAKQWINDLANQEQALTQSVENLADKYYKIDNLADKIDASVNIIAGLKTAISEKEEQSSHAILDKLAVLEENLHEISTNEAFENFKHSLEAALNSIYEGSTAIQSSISLSSTELQKINDAIQSLDLNVSFKELASDLNKSEQKIKEHVSIENGKVLQLVDVNTTRTINELSSGADSLTERINQAHSLIAALCEKSFGEVEENISNLKSVVSQIDENNVSANNAIFSNITDRLAMFENNLKTSLEKQEDYVANSSSQLVEQMNNIKDLSGVLDYKLDSSVIEINNAKMEFAALKSAVEGVLALDFVNKVKDLKVDLYAVKQDLSNAIENSTCDLSEKFSNDLFGKYELLISKVDSVETEIKQVQTNSLNDIKTILDNMSSSIMDILSYVGSKPEFNTDNIDSKLETLTKVVNDSTLNYVENIRDIVDVIRAQVESNIKSIQEDSARQFGSIGSKITASNENIRNDIKNSYEKLLEVQTNFDEIKEALKINNESVSNDINSVIGTADTLRNDFDIKLAALKNSILDKVAEFQQNFTCENADKISEIKFAAENLHSKSIQSSQDIKEELKGEITGLIGSLKLNIEELTEQLASSALRSENASTEIINYIKQDLTSKLEHSIDELEDSTAEFSGNIDDRVNEVVFKVGNLESSVNNLADKTTSSLTSTLAKILDNFVSLKALLGNLNDKSADDIKKNAAIILEDFSKLREKVDAVDSSIDEDLTRQLSLIESNFEMLNKSIEELFARNDSLLGEKINVGIKNIAGTVKNTVNETLEQYKTNIEEFFDKITLKNNEQTDKLSTKVLELNNVLQNSIREQSDKADTALTNISDKLKNILEKNLEVSSADYEALKVKLDGFAADIRNCNNNLAENLKAQLDDIAKFVDSGLDIHAQEVNAKFKEIFENITKLCNDEENLNKDINEKVKSIVNELNGFKSEITDVFGSNSSAVINKLEEIEKELSTKDDNLLSSLIQNISVISDLLENEQTEHNEKSDMIFGELQALKKEASEHALLMKQSLTENVVNETNDLFGKVHSLFEELSVNISTQFGNSNSRLLEDFNAKAVEIKAAFENLNDRLDKDELSKMNVFQSQLKELETTFNALIGEAKEVTKSEVSAISETLIKNSKDIMEDVEQSVETKVNSVLAASANISAGELQTMEIFTNKILDEVSANKQTVVACRDFIVNFAQNELKTISDNIEKETDVIVKDLLEQMNLLKDFQKDEFVKMTNQIENSVEDYIFNNINDLKSFLDVKTDSSVMNSKLDNISAELNRSVESILTASNKLVQADIFDNAVSDVKKANEILISSMSDTLSAKLQDFIKENISENISSKFNLFDKKFTDTIVDKYEEIKLVSSNYNDSFDKIKTFTTELIEEFAKSKDEISKTLSSVMESVNGNIDSLKLGFADLKAQILNKEFDEAFQSSLNNQIQDLQSLVKEQFSCIEDISDLCGENLPELMEMNALVKYNIINSLNELGTKLDAQENTVQKDLNNLKTDIITQFLNIFNQISFVTEQEEILGFIQEKHSELITILSHIVTTIDDVENIKDTIANVDNKVDVIKDDIANVDNKIDVIKDDISAINDKITSIITSDGNIDYVYSLQDLESDIANVRLCLNEIKEGNNSKELEELISSTNGIYSLVESIKKELPNLNAEEFKKDFEALNEDIVSISTRTNKLILASDESYKTLQENLQDFKLVINDLDERTRNFAHEAGLDVIDNKLGAINSMIKSGAKTNQVFNQVFEYLAEWVDNAGAQISSISDKVETLDDIGQIKVMLEDLKAESEDSTEGDELIEALSNVFDKQAKKISALEAKLDRVIVETTINNKNNKIDVSPLEETLNRFLVAIDDKVSSQQDKINSLESKLEDVAALMNQKDTAQLTKKVGGMDRQIAKLNKSIEKIASHVVEK